MTSSSSKISEYDAVIVGGGFFGAVTALRLRQYGFEKVLIVEKGDDLLRRASYNNQARVHNGYHYPRNIVTARRSHVNFPRFVRDFAECIDDSFEKVYAVSKVMSKVNAKQFRLFSERIGSPVEVAASKIKDLFNPDLIEEVFVVREYAFNSDRLKLMVGQWLRTAGVEVRIRTAAMKVRSSGGGIIVGLRSMCGETEVEAGQVFNCAYSQINQLLVNSGLPIISLKHELTELALVRPPKDLCGLGVTVMCGPFFSCMPFPALGLHSLSHVRYTPHCEWHDSEDLEYRDAHQFISKVNKKSAFVSMVKDAERYLPSVGAVRHERSLWEVKTVLPLNENDDGRPILFKKNHGLNGLTSIMGGKVDNIYDALDELDDMLGASVENLWSKQTSLFQ